jgi:lactoylglutathione lyase
MRVEHVALWVFDLERARSWWEAYFGATSGDEYVNAAGFHSYFLTFPDGGTRLELMWDGTQRSNEDDRPHDGYGHVAMSVGSEEAVDVLTARLVSDGYRCVSGPRTTGDGYYESCVLDAEGNRVEITV